MADPVRLVVVVDPVVGVSAAALVAAWEADTQAGSVGSAGVVPAGPAVLLPGVVELVVIPLLVNLATSVVYDLVRRVVVQARPKVAVEELELVESVGSDGDRVVVVRHRRETPL
jgi:hypothetical protein